MTLRVSAEFNGNLQVNAAGQQFNYSFPSDMTESCS